MFLLFTISKVSSWILRRNVLVNVGNIVFFLSKCLGFRKCYFFINLFSDCLLHLSRLVFHLKSLADANLCSIFYTSFLACCLSICILLSSDLIVKFFFLALLFLTARCFCLQAKQLFFNQLINIIARLIHFFNDYRRPPFVRYCFNILFEDFFVSFFWNKSFFQYRAKEVLLGSTAVISFHRRLFWISSISHIRSQIFDRFLTSCITLLITLIKQTVTFSFVMLDGLRKYNFIICLPQDFLLLS